MAVAIEIRRTSQPPTGRKCGTEHAANKNVIVQIPDCCLTRRRIADHKVPMAVAVKVSYYSRTCAGRRGSRRLKRQADRVPYPGGEGGLGSSWREFENRVAAKVRLKQIARAVKGQAVRGAQPGGEGALGSS